MGTRAQGTVKFRASSGSSRGEGGGGKNNVLCNTHTHTHISETQPRSWLRSSPASLNRFLRLLNPFLTSGWLSVALATVPIQQTMSCWTGSVTGACASFALRALKDDLWVTLKQDSFLLVYSLSKNNDMTSFTQVMCVPQCVVVCWVGVQLPAGLAGSGHLSLIV